MPGHVPCIPQSCPPHSGSPLFLTSPLPWAAVGRVHGFLGTKKRPGPAHRGLAGAAATGCQEPARNSPGELAKNAQGTPLLPSLPHPEQREKGKE